MTPTQEQLNQTVGLLSPNKLERLNKLIQFLKGDQQYEVVTLQEVWLRVDYDRLHTELSGMYQFSTFTDCGVPENAVLIPSQCHGLLTLTNIRRVSGVFMNTEFVEFSNTSRVDGSPNTFINLLELNLKRYLIFKFK